MFNALRTEQLIAGIGAVGRAAASASGPPDEYARGQLLSAYSVSRLLAAEVSAEATLLAWLRGELTAALAAHPEDPAAAAALPRIEAAPDSGALGDALVDLLAELRGRGDDGELRRRLQAILSEMAQRELIALAARPGVGEGKR
jgi:thioredoxin-like negative regulator of GroEL